MQILVSIAFNTFKETIRNKVLYNVLLFAGLIIALSISFGEWSVFARIQVMKDFGLATMSLSSLILAIFIGVAMLGKEVNSKTIYLMASKPIDRKVIVIGKYLGLLITLLLNYLIMSLFLILSLFFIGGNLDLNIFIAILLLIGEMAIMVAVSLFFSTITTPTVSSLCTIAFYIFGHFNDLVDGNVQGDNGGFLDILLKLLYYLLPNLEHFNIRTPVVYDLPITASYAVYTLIYGFLYTTLLLGFSCIIFSKKDL